MNKWFIEKKIVFILNYVLLFLFALVPGHLELLDNACIIQILWSIYPGGIHTK